MQRKAAQADDALGAPGDHELFDAAESASDAQRPEGLGEGALGDGSQRALDETKKDSRRRGVIAAAKRPANQAGEATLGGTNLPAAAPGLAGGVPNNPAPQERVAPEADADLATGDAREPLAGPQAADEFALPVPEPAQFGAEFAQSVAKPAQSGTGPADTYVIEVNLTPQAAREQAFEKLLARHQLTQLPVGREQNLGLQNQAAAASLPPAAGKGQRSAIGARVAGGGQAAKADGQGRHLPALREVTVAATADQFVATLRDLREHPDQFAQASFAFRRRAASALNRNGRYGREQTMPAAAAAAGAVVGNGVAEAAATPGAATQDAGTATNAPASSLGKGTTGEVTEQKVASPLMLERQSVRGGVKKATAVPLPGTVVKKNALLPARWLIGRPATTPLGRSLVTTTLPTKTLPTENLPTENLPTRFLRTKIGTPSRTVPRTRPTSRSRLLPARRNPPRKRPTQPAWRQARRCSNRGRQKPMRPNQAWRIRPRRIRPL